MPGMPRVEFEGAVYHVMCRGNRREAIFHSDGDRELFLETSGVGCARVGWRVHAVVLMGNHYHLLLETPEKRCPASIRDSFPLAAVVEPGLVHMKFCG